MVLKANVLCAEKWSLPNRVGDPLRWYRLTATLASMTKMHLFSSRNRPFMIAVCCDGEYHKSVDIVPENRSSA